MLTSEHLHGFSKDNAECFGKPHWYARYVGDSLSLTNYRRELDAKCMGCYRAPSNTHHQPDRHTFTLKGEHGTWTLRPALIALCGSGTTGCHGAVESNQLKIRWRWDEPEYEALWWSGALLKEYGAHSVRLYQFGCWELEYPSGLKQYRRIKDGGSRL